MAKKKDFEKFMDIINNQIKQKSLGYNNLDIVLELRNEQEITIPFYQEQFAFIFDRKTGRLKGVYNWRE